jgi:hypothetical protein
VRLQEALEFPRIYTNREEVRRKIEFMLKGDLEVVSKMLYKNLKGGG